MRLFIHFVTGVLTLISLAYLVGCSKNSFLSLNGTINQEFYTLISNFDLNGAIIEVTSSGGSNKYAIEVAKKIYKNSIHIEIVSECTSACVEFLLPAAESIKFIDKPLIAIHWGPILNFGQYKRARGHLNGCELNDLVAQVKLFEAKKLNQNFWHHTEKRLVLKHYELSDKPEQCPWKTREFENDFWLPTSKQLKEMWGLKFTGSVCADNISYCSNVINYRWPKGTRIVIGDEVYISKGR